MTDENIEIIRQEDYTEDNYSEQKIIFDSSIFEKVKGKEMDLSVEKVFEIPKIKNLFKRNKEEYYVLSQKEHIIDCKYTQGKAEVPLINKRELNKEVQKIKSREPIRYVHVGGIEILIKACFREGIDTPIELYLADDRIVEPIEKSIVSAVKGNLIYQKFKFTINANYSVALTDQNIDKALVLYWKISGITLTPGNKICTARCKNLYVLTTKHKISARSKIDRIKLDDPFEQFVKIIDTNDYSYKEIDTNSNLEIVEERIGRPRKSIIGIQQEHTKKLTYDKTITQNKYYILGTIENKDHLILINTGQEENCITEKLLSEEELDMVIKRKSSQLPTMIKTLVELDQEIIIAQIPMMITFEVVEKTYADIILGLNWLERLKPYKIEPTHITVTYDKKTRIIKRII